MTVPKQTKTVTVQISISGDEDVVTKTATSIVTAITSLATGAERARGADTLRRQLAKRKAARKRTGGAQ